MIPADGAPRLLEGALVVRFPQTRPCASTAVLGGGVGWIRSWLNLEVPRDYARTDPAAHLAERARGLRLSGPVVGMLTAAAVGDHSEGFGDGARAVATVGLGRPLAAAGGSRSSVSTGLEAANVEVGTINLLVTTAVPLSPTGLLGALQTAVEAKVQALSGRGVVGPDGVTPATGTATDSLCVTAAAAEAAPPWTPHLPRTSTPSDFAGPATPVGAAIASAVHDAVGDGVDRWRSRVASGGSSTAV
ncbi:adenosylcobinamide amidohydrolase [Egibacter rhizosphaerae]|uniref:Adenosylcobinamide amidohydrolase n=1 Tax=Egibacter rhizosphaerae TaxID=1670831 RepID=A0A411YEX7_9ACTN|nr:adenosylcobinamide amidohydrolase [Egibacter rhizosphaerae]QBI19813.1 adenosylcobinamide amidohydrolase [Egibacter rhizosphaerae]